MVVFGRRARVLDGVDWGEVEYVGRMYEVVVVSHAAVDCWLV